MRRIVLDTNVLVDWINSRHHEDWVLAPGFVRLLSSVVEMELRVGAISRKAKRAVDDIVRAHEAGARILCPTPRVFRDAGAVLTKLASAGLEIRRASLVNDVFLAVSTRSVGATLVTRDEDFSTIRQVVPFSLELIL